jgi:hypothetical protein
MRRKNMEFSQNSVGGRARKENGEMRNVRCTLLAGSVLVFIGLLAEAGCYHTPVDNSEFARGPAPLRMPSPGKQAETCDCYEDSLTGGQVFEMYCNYCHNAPSLAERNFANFKNVAAHMRVRANLTGKEYAKLLEFLGRWADVPPPTPPVEPSPKRFYFSQPIQELREQAPAGSAPAQPQAQPQGPAPDKARAEGES